jgi:xanthine dehydrogenase accessory factor
VPDVAKVRSPAGLDLGARTPPEVALSILAEIIQLRPSQSLRSARAGVPAAAAATVEPMDAPATAIDPVCGMTVTIATARQTADVDGIRYYFCGASCRAKFVQGPAKYLAPKA